MRTRLLILRGLTYYWRTNVAVALGVATATAVLAGALLVGDSVRASLRDVVLQRLGKTDHVIVTSGFVRQQLAEDVRAHSEFAAEFDSITPLIVLQGFASRQSGGGSAGGVQVYGVDNRFWQFHGISSVSGPQGREALVSPALARELEAEAGSTILIRVQRPSDVPLESLHGRKDELTRTLRLTVSTILPPETLGEFSLQAQQGAVRAAFVPLDLLQSDPIAENRVNALLVSVRPGGGGNRDHEAGVLRRIIRSEAGLEDLGLQVRALDASNAIELIAPGGLIDDMKVSAASTVADAMNLDSQPVFTYLANRMSSRGRAIPYSLVTAMDLPQFRTPAYSSRPPVLLNDWAARDLGVSTGDPVTLEYFVWEEPGNLATRITEFQVAGIIPVNPADRDLAPVFEGITGSATLSDWDPPFPIDLTRIRPSDEEYWEKYGTTPKAFIPIGVGQQLWRSRYGASTSLRLRAPAGRSLDEVRRDYADRLRSSIDPLTMGLAIQNVRAEGLDASRGATNFGEYFVYFSFFLVASALLLTVLFFKLSVEQRVREVGLLRAVGFGYGAVRRLFLGEGLVLASTGAAAGVVGGVLYAYAMVAALGSLWIGATGTTRIALHTSAVSLAAGATVGILAGMGCIGLTLRGLSNISERSLLAGQLTASAFGKGAGRKWLFTGLGFALLGAALMAGATTSIVQRDAAFFGAGSALLGATLCFFSYWFGLPRRKAIDGRGWLTVSRLGMRAAVHRPARSVLSMAMIASATFILISVDAFRKDAAAEVSGNRSGTGGYRLLVNTLIPVVHDPDSREGSDLLGISGIEGIRIDPFRVRPGDDASCLNLYEPRNPRILAPQESFIDSGRFAFQSSLAANALERENPWLLLRRQEPDGAIPVIADANSMTYVLHRKLGEDFTIAPNGEPIRLRFVASLDDSIFQSELLMSQTNFLKLFPEREGYQFFLAETAAGRETALTAIEDALADFGADAKSTTERLDEFHRVENTYLSTFQMLGGLGLLLGTVGLGAVLIRNVMERRRELALLRAVGYQHKHFFVMALAENAVLLFGGLFTGAVCALLAIAPVLLDQRGHLPASGMLSLLIALAISGLMVSLAATAMALRSSVLTSLRAE